MYQHCAAVLCEYTSLGGGGDTPGEGGQRMSPWGDAAPQVSWPCWGWRWLRWGNASSPDCCRTSCGMRCACSTWYGPALPPCHVSPGSPCPELGVQSEQLSGDPMGWPPKQGARCGHSCGYLGGTVGGTLVAQLVGHWWHRYEDPGGADTGILLAQIRGLWWHRYGDSGGIDMEMLEALLEEPWWHCWWDTVGTDLGTLLAQIWGLWWHRSGDPGDRAGGTLMTQLVRHWWHSSGDTGGPHILLHLSRSTTSPLTTLSGCSTRRCCGRPTSPAW